MRSRRLKSVSLDQSTYKCQVPVNASLSDSTSQSDFDQDMNQMYFDLRLNHSKHDTSFFVPACRDLEATEFPDTAKKG